MVRVAHRQSQPRGAGGLHEVRWGLGEGGGDRSRESGLGAQDAVAVFQAGSKGGGVLTSKVHRAAVRPQRQLAADRTAERVPVVPVGGDQDALLHRGGFRAPERKDQNLF